MRRHLVRIAASILALGAGSVPSLEAPAAVEEAPLRQWAAPLFWKPDASERPAMARGARQAVGVTSTFPSSPMPFVAIAPCRVADTRGNGFSGAFGPPSLAAGSSRDVPITGACGIPAGAMAVSFNLTVTGTQGPGFLVAYPTGGAPPPVSSLNYLAGQTLANAAIVPLGTLGKATFVAGVSGTDLIIDVNGYYAAAGIVNSVTSGATTLTGDVTLQAGTNVTITPVGNTLTIDAAGSGLAAVSHDATLAGAGTAGTPLSVAVPLVLSTAGADVVTATSTTAGHAGFHGVAQDMYGFGVLGENVASGTYAFLGGGGAGVFGVAPYGIGVAGTSTYNYGVQGYSNAMPGAYGRSAGDYGVVGETGAQFGAGVVGYSADKTTSGTLGSSGYGVFSHGPFLGDGAKYFVEPHPTDPTKEIRYICLEGPEAGTYFRGTARIEGGLATIEVPEDFRIVTSATGLTVQVTANGEFAMLACVSKDLNRIVIRGSADVEFDYTVNGVRRAFEGHQPVSENLIFVPRSKGDTFARGLPAESVRRLKANGTLNEDGTINEATARRLGWDQRPEWKAKEARQGP